LRFRQDSRNLAWIFLRRQRWNILRSNLLEHRKSITPLGRSELSELCAVERTRLPKKDHVPATRGGTVPITTYRTPSGTSGRASPRAKVSPSASETGAQEGRTAPQGTGKAWAPRREPRVSAAHGSRDHGYNRKGERGKVLKLSLGRHRAPLPPNTRFSRFYGLRRAPPRPSVLRPDNTNGRPRPVPGLPGGHPPDTSWAARTPLISGAHEGPGQGRGSTGAKTR
jgi:hypothetical protein